MSKDVAMGLLTIDEFLKMGTKSGWALATARGVKVHVLGFRIRGRRISG